MAPVASHSCRSSRIFDVTVTTETLSHSTTVSVYARIGTSTFGHIHQPRQRCLHGSGSSPLEQLSSSTSLRITTWLHPSPRVVVSVGRILAKHLLRSEQVTRRRRSLTDLPANVPLPYRTRRMSLNKLISHRPTMALPLSFMEA